MRNRTIAAVGAGVAAAALGVTALQAPAGAGHYGSHQRGGTAFGLTDANKLVSFDLKLRDTRTINKVSGLSGDTRLVGIDYRVQDRRLYGVGDRGGVYTLSTVTAKATKVSQVTVALSGTSFGVDFNPAADRLRIVSDTGQNLRHDVNPGGATIADGALNTPPTAGTTQGVTAAAYTNNDLDPSTATSLFDLDTTQDQVSLQSPANSGQLAATGKVGVDAQGDAGFDIYSEVVDGRTTKVRGYATLKVDGRYGLYRVALLNGAVEKVRAFPTRSQVTDLAVVLAR